MNTKCKMQKKPYFNPDVDALNCQKFIDHSLYTTNNYYLKWFNNFKNQNDTTIILELINV